MRREGLEGGLQGNYGLARVALERVLAWGDRCPASPSGCHDDDMPVQRFGVRVAGDARGHAVIAVPFDPDEAWGAKAVHHVNGTLNGCRVRVTIAPGDSGWGFTLTPARMRGLGIEVGS